MKGIAQPFGLARGHRSGGLGALAGRDSRADLLPTMTTAAGQSHAHAGDRPCRLCDGHRRERHLLAPARPWWADLTSAMQIGFEIISAPAR